MDAANNPAAGETAPEDLLTVTLSKPIPVFTEQVSVLKMRKPTAADIISIGNPVKFSPFADPPSVDHDAPRMMAMIAKLANVPSSSVMKMEPEDFVSCAWMLSCFFMPRPGAI